MMRPLYDSVEDYNRAARAQAEQAAQAARAKEAQINPTIAHRYAAVIAELEAKARALLNAAALLRELP